VLRVLLVTATACLTLAGCGGSAEPIAARRSAPATSPAATGPAVLAPTCAPRPSELAWPDPVPDDLPVPPAATLTEVQERLDGLTVITFSTAISLRQSVLFLIEEMPAAGYTLARGDAENTEADAPFVKDGLRGVMRMIAVEPCRTDWLMAITTGRPAGTAPGGGSPLLPPRPGASPLPFG
jgi:hypothetical protein